MGTGTSRFRVAPDDELPDSEFPMHLAAETGNIENLKRCLDSGMPLDGLDSNGLTPLHYAAIYGHYEAAKLLIRSNCDFNACFWDGKSPVLLATRHRQEAMVELLVRSGADVSACNEDGWTVLHYAAYKEWFAVVKLIAENESCDLNVKTSDGDTALLMAARIRNYEIVEFLIASGANVCFSGNEQWTILHYAAYEGWPDIVRQIIEKETSIIEAKDIYGNTPLHMACYRQHVDIIRQLIKAGANVNVFNNNYESTFDRLRKINPNLDAIKLLIEHGACFNTTSYWDIFRDPLLKEQILRDVNICAQAVVNQFNNKSLPELYCLTGFEKKLPHIKTLKITGTQNVASDIRAYVASEISTKSYCNVLAARPIVLKIMCVNSMISRKTQNEE